MHVLHLINLRATYFDRDLKSITFVHEKYPPGDFTNTFSS